MVKIERNILIIAGVVLGILVFGLLGLQQFFGYQTTTLSAMTWKDDKPPLIAIPDETREGHTGLLFVRLQDAKEQFIAGTWDESFTDAGDTFAFGTFPPGYSSSTGQQMYAIRGGTKIYSIDLKGMNGTVWSVDESKNLAYLAVSLAGSHGPSVCVSDWSGTDKPTCDAARAPGLVKSVWDPASDHILVSEDASGTIYAMDMWNNGLVSSTKLLAGSTSTEYARLSSLFNPPPPKEPDMWKLGDFLVVDDAGQWSLHRVPSGAKLGWLDDGAHLLVKQADHVGVYDLKTSRYAPVLDESGIGLKRIVYRHGKTVAL